MILLWDCSTTWKRKSFTGKLYLMQCNNHLVTWLDWKYECATVVFITLYLTTKNTLESNIVGLTPTFKLMKSTARKHQDVSPSKYFELFVLLCSSASQLSSHRHGCCCSWQATVWSLKRIKSFDWYLTVTGLGNCILVWQIIWRCTVM